MSEYVGSRIVPKPCGEWDKTKEYDVLSVVLLPSSGDSYIARKDTPAGTDIGDEEYWMLCSEFNAQLKALSDTVSAINSSVTKLSSQVAANVSASTDSDADYAAEVVDARTLLSGAVKASLGEALRTVDKYATTYNAVSKSLTSYVTEDEDGNSLLTLSDVIEAGLYVVSDTLTLTDKPDDISYKPSGLIVLPFRLADSNGIFTIQILCSVSAGVDTWYWRTRTSKAWTDWVRFSPDLSGYALKTALANYLPLSSIVSSTGDNTDKVMSQYALTELNNGFPKASASYRNTDDDGELVTDNDGKYTITLSNILSPGSYIISDQWTVTDKPDGISYAPGALIVQRFQTSVSSTSFTIQWLGSVARSDISWYWRTNRSTGSFTDWQRVTPDLSGYALSSALDNYALKTSLDDYLLAANVVSAQGTGTDKVISQDYLTSYANAFGKSSTGYYAVDDDGEYVLDEDGKQQITLGDITSPGYYIISDTITVTDKPSDISYKPSALIVQHLQPSSSKTFTLQWLGSCSPPSKAISWYWRSLLNSGSWSSWQRVTPDLSGYATTSDVEKAVEEAVEGISQEVNNNTYEITKVTNQYSNTYEVSCSPEITTDTNNYLAATGDKTDMAASIAAMLEETGVCHLGPGNFYTTGVDMPNNSTVVGCGRATRVYLLSSVEDGYVFRMGSCCSIADMNIYGNTSSYTVSENVGSRHGILFEGEADADTVTYTTQRGTIENVHIGYCDGGGITCYNTGYSHSCSLNVSDCVIIGCDAGINISYWSEFHRFSNCNCFSNYYGCINNGGNNMFSNCNFTGNKLGFLMDNTEGDQRNTAHGSANGCMFCHSDDNSGTGIKIINMANGFIFSGGQIFYSAIELENASGVVFEAMNCGRAEVVKITGCTTILFDHCIYGSAPVVTVDDDSSVVEFTNCYVRSTGAAVSI